ncbi:MAG: PAS domain S-box protein [Chloroflexi bacterium]|nr:PAS domain S-box protein [Chloroflexota bacterium]
MFLKWLLAVSYSIGHAASTAGLCMVCTLLLVPVVVLGHNTQFLIVPVAVSLAASVFAAYRQQSLWHVEQRNQENRSTEARFQALFDQASDAIFLLGADGNYLMVNQEAARLLGYTVDELVGMYYLHNVAESERAQAENALLAIRRGETLSPQERTLVRKDGSEIPVEISVSAVRDAQGELMFIQSTARDLTGRRQAEMQRLDLEVTHARMETLRRFIGEASHDLRTPIAVINTSLYLLRKKLPPEFSSSRHIDAMEAQTKNMVRILDNLGRLYDLDEADTPFSFGYVNLNTLVNRLLEQCEPLAQEKNLTLRARLAPGKVFVRADDVQLTRAVQNLVMNAINYTLDGGQVTVSVNASGSRALLEVRDTGIGISVENLPYIFDRFYRADTARPIHQGGLGLGLTITRKIIEIHGGTIEVESQPGQGSSFRILLPLPEKQPVGEQFI